MQTLKNELNNKEISLNEYKIRLNTLSDTHDKEIQELKKELKESKEYIDSDKKYKSKVMNKFEELNKEIQKHIKEKQIIEQKLNEKENNLTISKIKISDLEY